jgi:hypothetical protein
MRVHDEEHPGADRLIDLAAHLLDPPGRAAVLDHLRLCPQCEERFLDVWRQWERLELRAAPRRRLETHVRKRSGNRRAIWAAAAAAVLLVSLIVTELPRTPGNDGLDYWLPIESERLLLRSAPPDGRDETRFAEALEAYERHDAERVLRLLDGRPIPREFAPMTLFLASALVATGRHESARRQLEKFQIHTLPQPARDRALWILYVALRRGGRAGEARDIARLLRDSGGEFTDRAVVELQR